MANSKISALTSATTPLAGTEVLPVVQSSATTQVTVANLTAGRAISATSVTATAGAFINSSTAGTASLDVSGNTLTLANLATVTFSSFSGLIAVNCASVGSSTLYIAGGGTVTQIGTAGVAQGTLLYNAAANGYRWTNTSGAAFVFSFCAIRLRTAA
jgi:hypothetical protein